MQVILPAWAIWEWFISPAGASPVWIQTLQLAQTLQLCAALCTHLKKKNKTLCIFCGQALTCPARHFWDCSPFDMDADWRFGHS